VRCRTNGRGWQWLAAVVVAGIALTGCGSSSSKNAITVYSGQHEQTMGKLVADFTKRTGIKVNLRSADEASLANQVLREGSDSPADVFVAENPPAQTVLDNKGLLGRVDASTLAKVPSRYSAPSHDWVGLSARSAVLAYNTKQVKDSQLPTPIADLAQPQWKGKVGFAPTETDFQPLITVFAKLHGAAAAKTWPVQAEGQRQGLRRQRGADRGRQPRRGRDRPRRPLLLVPAARRGRRGQGSIRRCTTGAPVTQARSSTSPARRSSSRARIRRNAQRFLAYLVSKPAQEIVATSESYEYPIASGVQTTKVAKPLSVLRPPNVSSTDLGDGRSALQMLQDVGLI